jgi:hypothetical protein
MRIRATVVKALAAGALLAGVAGVAGAGSASALTLNTFYVSPHGTTNVSNDCTNKQVPCLTIQQALTKAQDADVTSATISLAKGIYNQPGDSVSLGATDNNFTITGTGTENAKTGLYKAVIESTNTPVLSISGATGAAIENLSVNGDPTDAGNGSGLGVSVSGANTVQNVSVTNIDKTSSGIGVELNGSTANNVTVGGSLCTAITKTALPAGNDTDQIVSLTKKIPKCAGTVLNSSVTIGGQPFTVDSAGKKALAIDSGSSPAPAGTPADSEVVFDPTVAAYTLDGIVLGTDGGTVSGSHVTGSGAAALTGINAEGAEAGPVSIQGTSVAGNGTGIALEVQAGGDNIGTTAGNSLSSGNTEGLVIDGEAGETGTVAVGSTTASGNSYSGSSAGIVANCLSSSATLSITDTSASGSGASLNIGVLYDGVYASSEQGDTISGAVGELLLANTCPGPTLEHSANNLIGTTTGNNISGSLVAGLVVAGPADPIDITSVIEAPVVDGGLGNTTTQSGNTGNTFDSNTWSGLEAGLIDFTAFQGEVAPSCTLGDVTLTSAIVAGTVPGPISVSNSGPTCSLRSGTNLEVTGLHEELYVTSTTNLPGSTTGNSVPSANFLTIAAAQLNNGAAAGAQIAWDEVPASNSATGNTYGAGATANSPSPTFNAGSAELSGALGDPGYFVA